MALILFGRVCNAARKATSGGTLHMEGKPINGEREETKGHPEAGRRLVALLAVPKGEKLV